MRLLIVEDDHDLLGILADNFGREGFAVDTADNGELGSFRARTEAYDAIILDKSLPGKDGTAVCREIRETVHTPIIMLSVHADASTKAELLNAGADDYVGKPFSFEELLARVRAVLRRPRRSEAATLAAGDIVLDPVSHKVLRAGKEVRLTPKEFSLLRFFMSRSGDILSRAMIMEHVWDAEANPFSNTIEVHVQNLRRKLGDAAKKRLIRTVPGRGYRMEA